MANYFLDDDGNLIKKKKNKKGNNYTLGNDGKLILNSSKEENKIDAPIKKKSSVFSQTTDDDKETYSKFLDLAKKEYGSLSKEDLLTEQKKIKEQMEQNKGKDYKANREWWNKDDSLLRNLGNVVYKSVLEKDARDYTDEHNEMVARYDALSDMLTNKTIENKTYNKGFTGFAEKSSDVLVGNAATGVRGIETSIKKILGVEIEEEDIAPTYSEQLSKKAMESSKGVEKIALDVQGSVGRMLPQMIAPAGKVATAVGFANYGGGAYNQAREEGYTDEQATKYGLAIGSLEMATTKLLGSFGNIYGKTKVGNASQKIIGSVIPKIIKNKQVRNVISQFGSEATEEFLQEYIEGIARDTLLNEQGLLKSTWKNITDTEKLSNALYSAFVGGITGSAMSVQSQLDAYRYEKATGRNAETGLTSNEQKVVDNITKQKTTEIQKQKALNNEIDKQIKDFESTFGTMTEAEKTNIKNRIQEQLDSGEIDFSNSKLSKKELATIEKEVRADLEKGNIDIDTIEGTLSSEKTAQIKSLQEELTNTKDDTKKAEIEAKISELQNAKAEELRSLLSKDMFLQRSYEEANRKNEQFTYEAAETDSEYKKSLVEDFKKTANNTTKSHELFETISKIAEDKQTPYGIINNNQLKQLGYDIEGKDVNGLVRVNKDGTQKVLINIDSNKAINRIVGHETTHLLEGTNEYKELQQMVKQYAITKGDYDTKLKEITRLYDGIDADIEAEITSDLVGDYLFTDEAFVNNLSTQKPTIFQKIYNEIKHLYNLATAGSEEARQLEKVKHAFDKAYKENASNMSETDTKYAVSESITDNQGRTLTKEQQEYFKDTKAVDENGNIKVLYHGTPNEFNKFSYEFLGTNGTLLGKGFYLTDDINVAKAYANKGENGKVMELYADIKKPLKWGETTISKKQFQNFVEAVNQATEGRLFADYSGEYSEKGSKQYNSTLNDILMDYEYGGDDIDLISGILNSTGMSWDKGYKILKDTTGYDGIIVTTDVYESGEGNVYIPFQSSQIKNVDNINPTTNEDIRMSLGNQEQAPVRSDIFGSDIKLQVEEAIAPLKEAIAEIKEAIDSEYESKVDYSGITEADLPMWEQQIQEAFRNINDSDATPDIEPTADYIQDRVTMDTKSIKALSKNMKGELNLKRGQIAELENIIQEFSTKEDVTREDLFEAIKEKFGTENVETNIEEIQEIKRVLRNSKVKVSEIAKTDIADYNKVKQKNFGKIRFSNDGLGIDQVYQELSSQYPSYFPNDILSESDQLLRMFEVANMDSKTIEEFALPDNYIQEVSDYIYDSILDYNFDEYKNATLEQSKIPYDDSMIPAEEIEEVEDIAPVVNDSNTQVKKEIAPIKQLEEESVTTDKEVSRVEQQTAKILEEKPTPKNRDKKLKAIATVNLIDKGYYISKLARKTNNRQLDALWDNTLLSNAQAQEVIGEGRFKFNENTKSYEKVGNSVYEIFEGLETTNKVKDFNEYMYHKLNVERMSLEDNAQSKMKALRETTLKGYTNEDINAMAKLKLREDAKQETVDLVEAAKEYKSLGKVKNKPVFGFTVDANESIEIVNRLEQNNPEFSDYAKKVYNYESGTYSDLSLLVESGILSQEDANYYRNKYESYVPIIRDMEAEMMEKQMFGKRVSVGNAVKSATGGNQNIIPLKDAMAIKTMLVQRSANMNKLGLELMDALNSTVESEVVSAESIIEDISGNKDLIKAGTNGKAPTMTVYEHGVKKTFEIPQEIYEALKNNYDSVSKTTIKPLNAFSNFKRNVLTQYNPFFMVTNMIKDAQDVLINSQHPASTYKSVPEAIAQLTQKGYWYKEMQAQGLFQDTYYDNQGGFDTAPKGIEKIGEFYPLKKIAEINNFIERVPRMAEYIASRKAGRSVEVSSLDASRVTTNFKAGGDWTKFFNRNGATFLNASIQGALQQVRNVQEAHQNGLKGYMGLATKFAVASLPAVILNNLIWDDDDDYEELSEYIKDNYYIIGKYGDGQFIRIPKGRMTAVIQKTIEEMQNLITGDDEIDLRSYLELVVTNIAPSNPIENNIFSPFINTKLFNNDDAGKTWYGGDLVPTRLQSKPAAEQYDETTDEFSKWLGEKLNLSPIKINNLIDQNTGVIGDLLLPMMTAESKTKNDNPIMAGVEDKFTADVVFDNKYSTDFYSVKEELAKKSNSYEATDEDVLKTKYMNSKQAQMNDIYAEIREVQNSDLDKKTKYAKVRELRKELNDIAENSLNDYKKVNIESSYAKVGDIEFRKNDSGEWQKITSKQLEKQNEATNNLGVSANNYWKNKDEYDYAIENPTKYDAISQIDTYDNYIKYKDDIANIKEQYQGYPTAQRKAAVQQYIESLSLSVPKKIMLEKLAGGYSIKAYENYMYQYIESLPMTAKEKQELHKQLFD